VKAGQDERTFRLEDIEDAVREAAQKRPSNLTVHDRIDLRMGFEVAHDGLERGDVSPG
jgi:hypothetical protein